MQGRPEAEPRPHCTQTAGCTSQIWTQSPRHPAHHLLQGSSQPGCRPMSPGVHRAWAWPTAILPGCFCTPSLKSSLLATPGVGKGSRALTTQAFPSLSWVHHCRLEGLGTTSRYTEKQACFALVSERHLLRPNVCRQPRGHPKPAGSGCRASTFARQPGGQTFVGFD